MNSVLIFSVLVLLNPLIQKTIQQLKEKLGVETVETFLKDNEKNIKKNIKQKLENPKKAKDKKTKKKAQEKVESEGSESEKGSDDEDQEDSGSEQEETKTISDEPKGEETKEESSEEVVSDDEKKLKLVKPKVSLKSKNSVSLKPPRKRNFKEEVAKKSSDSFFMTGSGENYLASVVNGASSASEDEAERPMLQKQNQNGKKFTQKFNAKRFDETPPAFVKRVNQPFKKPEFKVNQPFKKFDFKDSKSEMKAKQLPPPAKPDDGDIHPSWKAKAQMRKTQIQDFQGTKIKFDD